MYIDAPANPNGLVIVCDVRLKNDRDLQEAEGGQPVLRHWPYGKRVLGKTEWARTTRIALYDYGSQVTSKLKHEAQDELRSYLSKSKPGCTLVLQTRSAEQKSKDEFGDAQGLTGTHCWAALGTPDRLPDMAGCIWAAPWGPTIGTLNPVNYEHVYGEYLIPRWFKLALITAQRDVVLRPKFPGKWKLLSDEPIAVDIEAWTDEGLFMDCGFAGRDWCHAFPIEAHQVYGTDQIEPAGTAAQLLQVRALLASPNPKLFHNYSFDVPFLRAKGFEVNGAIHDTMAMHVCVYKQWPHGLQRACAQELPVPPWKSMFHPQFAKRLKLTRKDKGWWTAEPQTRREYCSLDAFYTHHLGLALAPKVGIKL